MEELTIEHFTRVCRFCLIQLDQLQMISNVPSTDIFRKVVGTELTHGFEYMLPQKICLSCSGIFQTFLKFIEKSKTNIDKLKAIYKQQRQHKIEFADSDDEQFNYDCAGFNGKFEVSETVVEENCEREISKGNNRKHLDFKCKKCEKKFSSQNLLEKHFRLENCRSTISYNKREKGFRKRISKPRVARCKNCKLVFKSRADLIIHSKGGFKCQPMDFKCPECNKLFKKLHKLNIHMRSHTKEAPFQCTECEKTFRFQQNLKRHLLIHEGIKKFKCEDCGKAFSRAHVLNEHRNIHTGHNPYICDYCGKGFKRYANHFIHVHRHKLLNGEIEQTKDNKLYLQLQCNVCNKIFASRGGLQNHLTLHQDEPREKKFLCTECGKGFNTNAQVDSHMRTHTGDRPFECNHCEKKFKQKSAYSNHQLVHTGEKPHQCKVCERLFTQSGHLKVHMRVHSGEKPFVCNFCGRKFALKSNLKVHTRTHTGEKPYVCSVCDSGYYDSTSLKKHMKSHGVGLPSHGHINSQIENIDVVYCSNIENPNEEVLSEHTGS